MFGFIDNIKVDFVNYPYPLLHPLENMGVARLANTLDIAGMKVNAIVGRGSRKDFFDLHRLLREHSMESIMEAYSMKYGLDNIQQASMALAYFRDAEDDKQRDNKFQSFMEYSWVEVKKDITQTMDAFKDGRIVLLAIDFHNSVDYPNKVPNVRAFFPNGALSIAFQQRYGIILTKQQLEMVDKGIDRKRKRGYGFNL